MTSPEKHIYNSFLRVSRSKQNNPYRIRQNFDGFEDTENYVYVNRIHGILKRNQSIDLNDYLIAPYEVYSDGNFYDLKFYCSQKAIKVYTMYIKKRESQEADTDANIEKIKQSLFFIYKFCIENNIELNEYIQFKGTDSIVNPFILHMQERKVSIYVLFGLPHFESELTKIPYDVREFIIGELAKNVDQFRRRYYESRKAKLIITKGLEELEIIIKKKLNLKK